MARTNPHVTAAPYLPARRDLAALRRAAQGCRGCDLWQRGTQTVFGEGDPGAPILFVGEQPGDQEDLTGRPFVGPAGRLLDTALERAGIERDAVYVTNAVKHFKWSAKGKRRIHAKPDKWEVDACAPWLTAELAAVTPRVVVVLGATAAQALLGPSFRVTQHRGEFLPWPPDAVITATVHPSSILRSDDREAQLALLVADLRLVAKRLRAG
ncbi:MAG: UdgX family uracil-DNA binding protein [Mycobacteriales bacterium]|nr:UdgX family uracil-DNA binding protein [Frankia sp.]